MGYMGTLYHLFNSWVQLNIFLKIKSIIIIILKVRFPGSDSFDLEILKLEKELSISLFDPVPFFLFCLRWFLLLSC